MGCYNFIILISTEYTHLTAWKMFRTILSLVRVFSLRLENGYSIPYWKLSLSGNLDGFKLFGEFFKIRYLLKTMESSVVLKKHLNGNQ